MTGVIIQLNWEIHPILPNGYYAGSPTDSNNGRPVVIEVKCDDHESAKQKIEEIIKSLRSFNNANN